MYACTSNAFRISKHANDAALNIYDCHIISQDGRKESQRQNDKKEREAETQKKIDKKWVGTGKQTDREREKDREGEMRE